MMNREDLLKHMSPDVLSLNPQLSRDTEQFNIGAEDSMAKRSKLGNKKVQIDGIWFMSIKEGNRYNVLKAKEDRGDIEDLVLQPKFELQPKFVTPWGEKIQAITYIADFMYKVTDEHNVVHAIVEDVKGSKAIQTKAFRIKWKMLLYAYRERPFYEFKIVV
jgi:hypothetical protein